MIVHLKSAVFLDCCAIGAGAVCGALLRYGASKAQARYRMEPWAIPAINIAGSFVLGALSVSSSLNPRLKLMAGTGFCGALTTFSTFSVDTVQLLHQGKLAHAVGYVLVNNVGGILAAALAIKLFRGSMPPPPPGASPRGGYQQLPGSPTESFVRVAGSAHPPPPQGPHKRVAAWMRPQQPPYRPLPSPRVAPLSASTSSFKRAG